MHPPRIARLRRALKSGELRLHYQPIVSTSSGRVVGAEALVRWPHPRRGLLRPAAFLPALDASRAGSALNRFVLETATQQASIWQQVGPSLQLYVNVSPRWLRDELVEMVAASLERSNLHPSLLNIEITEVPGVRNGSERASSILERLHALGVAVALDDFGRGTSSLQRLASLRVDTLKIDRSFVSSMVHDRRSAGVVRSSIQLAHSFEMQAVAEGVETAEQWDLLRAWSCDLAQGFLLSRPAPPEEFEAWLTREAPRQLRQLAATSRPLVDRRVGPGSRRRVMVDRRESRRLLHHR